MGLFQRFRDATRKNRAMQIKQEIAGHLYVNPLCSDYENVFAQVQPLINDMKVVMPYGVGANGAKLLPSRTPELTLLNTPNDEMGWGEFSATMFATWLTEAELNIHVHLNHNKVIGYTILPPGCKVNLGNGNYYFQVMNGDGMKTLSRDEVMTLRFSRLPRNIQQGVSPAMAVRAWAQTEDVLAQYERAYIENGAIPASITFIRASTPEKFQKVRDELEENLRGARNKGKTIYVWRQFNNDTGESLDQVEVKTIQGNNSTLAIRELTDIINDHLNKAFGVSNFILGDDSSAKYDNAELSDYQFIKRRVYPALLGFWDQFQFELDRIVGGLGYAIQFDLTLPELTEREKVRAETNQIKVQSLISLVQAGAPPLAAVNALGLGKAWERVSTGISSHSSVLVDMKTKNNKKLLNCSNSLNMGEQSGHLDSAAPASTTTDKLPPMDKDERKIYDVLVAMAERIFANTPNIDAEGVIVEIEEVLRNKARLGGVDGVEHVSKLLNDSEVVAELKATVESFEISNTLKDRIRERTTALVGGYEEQAREIMQDVLTSSVGMSAGEIRQALREVMPTYQAERIARTETIYAFKSGRLDEDQRIADKYGLKMKLIWRSRHDGAVCDVCAAMDGEKVTVGDAFEHYKETADGAIAWEPSRWNDDGRIPAPHPNCRCYFDEIVEED